MFRFIGNYAKLGKSSSGGGLGGFSTGDIKPTLKNTADVGFVMCDDGTIGSASSGATTRANADTEALYTLLWNNVYDGYAPVTGGRGASAAADFAANKSIALTKMLGRALAASGVGSGLTSRGLGEALGEEEHTLSTAELPSHTHDIGGSGAVTHANAGTGVFNIRGTTASFGQATSTLSQGSGSAHNIMQPTSFVNFMICL